VVTDALSKYGERVQALQADIKRRDVANVKAAKAALSSAELAAAKSAFKAMPADLQRLLAQSRAADGTRIINNIGVLKMITTTFGTGGDSPVPQQGQRAALQQELAELNAIRDRDVSELYMRELNGDAPAKPSASQIKSEEADLLALYESDPMAFEYAKWRDSGMTGSERLYRLRQGRI
jgi:hypothetical protein